LLWDYFGRIGRNALVVDFALGGIFCFALPVAFLLDWHSLAWDYPGAGKIAQALPHLQ
jgi:hypothetical protein